MKICMFSGATLSKGLNRGCATLLAGALGVGGQHLATTFGERGEPIILGALVFILGKRSLYKTCFANNVCVCVY